MFSSLFQNKKSIKTWLLAITTVIVIAGGSYIEDDIKSCLKPMNKFLKKSLIKKVVVFSAIYLNTQDIYISIASTVFYTIIFDVLLGKPLSERE